MPGACSHDTHARASVRVSMPTAASHADTPRVFIMAPRLSDAFRKPIIYVYDFRMYIDHCFARSHDRWHAAENPSMTCHSSYESRTCVASSTHGASPTDEVPFPFSGSPALPAISAAPQPCSSPPNVRHVNVSSRETLFQQPRRLTRADPALVSSPKSHTFSRLFWRIGPQIRPQSSCSAKLPHLGHESTPGAAALAFGGSLPLGSHESSPSCPPYAEPVVRMSGSTTVWWAAAGCRRRARCGAA